KINLMVTGKNKEEAFHLLLKKMKSEDLKAFVKGYADKDFQSQFLLHFAEQLPVPGNEKYRLLVNSIIDSAKQPNGETDVIDAQKITRQLNPLIELAQEQIFSRNYIDPFHLAVAIILEAEDISSQTDAAFLMIPVEQSFDMLR